MATAAANIDILQGLNVNINSRENVEEPNHDRYRINFIDRRKKLDLLYGLVHSKGDIIYVIGDRVLCGDHLYTGYLANLDDFSVDRFKKLELDLLNQWADYVFPAKGNSRDSNKVEGSMNAYFLVAECVKEFGKP